MKTLKLSVIATVIIIGYHIGNMNEIAGMFKYAKKHSLHIVKTESVNNSVLVYWSK